MIKNKQIRIALAVVLFLIILVAVTGNRGIKETAPDFTLEDLKGDSVQLSSFFEDAGNVVVLVFWGSWCPSCKMEVPELIKLQSKYAEEPVKVVGVALDEELADVEQFAKLNKINYAVLHDPSGTVANKYNSIAIPTVFIIDKSGIIRFKHTGFPAGAREQKAEMARIEKEIKLLLK